MKKEELKISNWVALKQSRSRKIFENFIKIVNLYDEYFEGEYLEGFQKQQLLVFDYDEIKPIFIEEYLLLMHCQKFNPERIKIDDYRGYKLYIDSNTKFALGNSGVCEFVFKKNPKGFVYIHPITSAILYYHELQNYFDEKSNL